MGPLTLTTLSPVFLTCARTLRSRSLEGGGCQGAGRKLISDPSYVLRYHCRHLGTEEEEKKKKKKKERLGNAAATKIGKETPKRSNELDLLGEICQTLYHTRSILSGIAT